ncbi:Receptor-type guanylate cyclase gcy [Seminavis robusta]|uniref:Receptor-type guanylate cyclase gcy n=1 Tax=Seminavis robusta TaxID=568900 RepID=A0A9N8DHG6_9STRA|nr:Receptor-type guanylate cyclase gcy [Seminavis robusta]|eukprot:Sro145_g067220.1 Receptor-type guanylate cyclase gcy (828) ;mRNA; f:25531-28543
MDATTATGTGGILKDTHVDLEAMDPSDDSSYMSSQMSGAAVEAEQKRLRQEMAESLATRENKAVCMLRFLVMALMMTVTALVLAGVYIYSSHTEQSAFETGFAIHATQMTQSFTNVVESKLVAIGSMSNAITSHALFTGSEFPFVTLPDFAARGSDIRVMAEALVLGWCPLVTNNNRLAWEEFAFMNRYQMNKNFEQDNHLRQDQDEYFEDLAMESSNPVDEDDSNRMLKEEQEEEEAVDPDLLQDGSNYHLRIYNPFSGLAEPNGTGPFLPEWQRSPSNNQIQKLINLNWDKAGVFKGADIAKTLMANPRVIINKLTVIQPKFYKPMTASLQASQYRNRVDTYLEDPLSFLAYPVFDSFNSTTRKLGGVLIANLYWQIYFRNVLPPNAKGVICVLSNSYNQTFSYLVNGPNATLLGPGDLHDPHYNDMGVSLDVSSFVKRMANAETRAYLTVPLHETVGLYTLKVYPTDDTRDEYTSNNPIIYTLVVGVIFVLTAIVFGLFDTCVEKRQRKVMSRAVESGAIVRSLFPEAVQSRMFQDEPTSTADTKTEQTSWKVNANQGHGLEAVSALETKSGHLKQGGQIADEYMNCTVIFSDLAGFTAWSSTRSPCEVFELLETIYNAMDGIALKRRVFKVETIGDCWLGVCGLPNPNPKHAVATARFAHDCMKKVQELVMSLSDRLGSDTGLLQLRTGLHSGSVTAGVLRGQKSRFQLFGDTVNTASRIETTGKPGRIHASKTTADILMKHGKESWLQRRENKITAKGKGEMQTYWIDMANDNQTCVTGSSLDTSSVLMALDNNFLDEHENDAVHDKPQTEVLGQIATEAWT